MDFGLYATLILYICMCNCGFSFHGVEQSLVCRPLCLLNLWP